MHSPLMDRTTALVLVITTILFCVPAVALGTRTHHKGKAHAHHAHQHRTTRARKHSSKAPKSNKAVNDRHRRRPPTPSGTTTVPTTTTVKTTPTTTTTVKTTPTTTAVATVPTTTTTPSTAAPSGEAMPTGDIAGWHQIFSDNFTESTLNTWSVWQPYWGQPGGDVGGWWNTNHITLSNGMLNLRGYKDTSEGAPAGTWATAGVAQRTSQTYGKWMVRAKMDNGKGIAPVLLLWPQSNTWPTDGEIDFAEDGGQNSRSTEYTTVVYYGACGTWHNCQHQVSNPVNWSQWHTYGVEWTPGKVVFTLDGRAVATVTSNIPRGPMHLAMQDQMEGSQICGGWEACPDATTPAEVDFHIDWMADYSPAS